MSEENFGNIFNTESFDLEFKFDKEQFNKKIVTVLQKILDKKFGQGFQKSKIIPASKGYNFACPICGDSHTSATTKRGHLYLNTYSFKCYNDHVGSSGFMSLGSFIKFFNMQGEFSDEEIYYVDKKFEELIKTYKDNSGSVLQSIQMNGVSKKDLDNIYQYIKLPEINEYAFPREEIIKTLRLSEIGRSIKGFEYLVNRKIITQKNQSTTEFLYNDYFEDLYILNLASDRKNILGMQIRHCSPKTNPKRRFDSYNWSDIWEKIFKCPQPEELCQKFDKQSMTWGLMFVDYSKPIYHLEGAIDAYFLPNSIASLGVGNTIENKQCLYITDNDIAGRKKAIDLLEKGFMVFKWKEYIEEMESQRFYGIRDCKDINDIIKKFPHIKFDAINKHFTNNELDSIFL